ncbi:MAG: hypothetical protein ACRETN_02200, partial [Nevskiales bacterium]
MNIYGGPMRGKGEMKKNGIVVIAGSAVVNYFLGLQACYPNISVNSFGRFILCCHCDATDLLVVYCV